LVDRYETAFRKRIKGADLTESRRFYGMGPDYKSLLLAMLLMQPEGNTAREYVRQKLSIERIGLPIPGTNELTDSRCPAYAAAAYLCTRQKRIQY